MDQENINLGTGTLSSRKMEVVEEFLLKNGYVCREDIQEKLGMGPTKATMILKRYKEVVEAHGLTNVMFRPQRAQYEIHPEFRPLFTTARSTHSSKDFGR